jgi:hypothetical protein
MANTTNTGLTISTTGTGTNVMTDGQKLMVAGARLAFEPAQPDPDLIEVTRIPQGFRRWDVQTVARMADAAQLSEGLDLTTTQQIYLNSVTITPVEHGIIATVSNELVRRQGNFDVMSTTGEMLGRSLRRRMAKDVVELYDGLSKSTGAGGQLDVTAFRGTVAYLLTDNDSEYGPAELPIHAALHIEQISDIIFDITDPGTAAGGRPAGFGDVMLQKWWRGSDRLYGIPIFHSGVIPVEANNAKGAIFSPKFAALVMATEAEATEEKDNSLRAVELGIFQVWSEAEIADPYGVEIYSDVTTTI